MGILVPSGTPVNLTASGTVSKVSGQLLGFYVNSTSSGTIAILDGATSSGTAISGTITPAIGWHSFPAYCTSGCYVTIGATLNVTLFFSAG
jgi:hypothetical protein